MVDAYILVKVRVGFERKVVDGLKGIKEVVDVNELYGEWDTIAKIHANAVEDLDKIISDKIRAIEGIKLTSTMIVASYTR